MVSVQLPDLLAMLKVSSPPQPSNSSLPAPPLKVSSPAPPMSISLPEVPLRVWVSVEVDCKSVAVTTDEAIPVRVIKVSLPFLISVSLPLATMLRLDEVIEESKPMASVPSVKSVKVSLPDVEVITMTSLPEPEMMVSAPTPPSRVSSPSSP